LTEKITKNSHTWEEPNCCKPKSQHNFKGQSNALNLSIYLYVCSTNMYKAGKKSLQDKTYQE